jgi:DNA sulfur modification protein DndD
VDLEKTENRKKELILLAETLQEREELISANIENIEDDLRETQQRIRILQGSGSMENSARLETRKSKEEEVLAEALSTLAEAFEKDAFLRLNTGLAVKAMKAAESCANSQRNAHSELLQSLKDDLVNIFTKPPYPDNRLNESQIRFYKNRIIKEIDARDVQADENGLFHIDTGRAKRLVNLLASYQPERSPALELQHQLERGLRADRSIADIDHELQNVNQLSGESKILKEQLENDLERVQSELLDKKDSLRKNEHEYVICQRDIKPLDEKISTLEGQAKLASKAIARIRLLDQIHALLSAYKQKLKAQKREVLEHALNQHVKKLLDSNELLDSVEIDEHFLLSYKDKNGNAIPMSSLAAGMKQLSATALLWALKDASGSQLPVIIDTPLGRIDRQHQENLLRYYYPNAGGQVIILPTDSELDDRKSELLAPHIYREYRLHNPSGESTEITIVAKPEAATHE